MDGWIGFLIWLGVAIFVHLIKKYVESEDVPASRDDTRHPRRRPSRRPFVGPRASDREVKILETSLSSKGECQICGTELEGIKIRCSACSTTHHADCWSWTGGCSTFACENRPAA